MKSWESAGLGLWGYLEFNLCFYVVSELKASSSWSAACWNKEIAAMKEALMVATRSRGSHLVLAGADLGSHFFSALCDPREKSVSLTESQLLQQKWQSCHVSLQNLRPSRND